MSEVLPTPTDFVPVAMSQNEFAILRNLFGQHLGFRFPDNKRQLLAGRLSKRLQALAFTSFEAYSQYLLSGHDQNELQRAIDLVTTNETHFFRENTHFEFLTNAILPNLKERHIRVWSAACSSGQEPYSIAMLLADYLGWESDWEIEASDISERVLQQARRGLYRMAEAEAIPTQQLKRYCLRGNEEYTGQFLIQRRLRERVHFRQLNLMNDLPEDLQNLDVVFLRNVMIYFENEYKTALVTRIRERIKPGGYLIIGLAESMALKTPDFRLIHPSVYQRI